MATKKSSNPLTAMSAGCIAGAVEATCVWPMEYIKTQLQLGSRTGSKLPYKGMVEGLSYTVRTTGFFRYVRSFVRLRRHNNNYFPFSDNFHRGHCFHYALIDGNSRSLYRGLAPTLIGSVPKAGIRFGLNSVIKEKLRGDDGKLTPAKNFVAGLGAGVSEALVIVAPVETVKTKVIELNMPFIEGMKHILKTEGLGGVYKGVRTQDQVCWEWLFELCLFFMCNKFAKFIRHQKESSNRR